MSTEIHEVENLAEATDFEKKHFPTLSVDGSVVTVEVGKEVPHPMGEDHWITYIELYVDNELYKRIDIAPTESPYAVFTVEGKAGSEVYALEDCNLHGVWKSNVEKLG